jgi:ubiquinone/menaquinone biosynthesis C-methylase UbiE
LTALPKNFLEETHWEKAAKTRIGKYLTKLETDFILGSVGASKLSFVLDIGAEAGRFSIIATNKNVTVIGIDIDSYSLRRLKQKNRDITVIQADARKIPLKPDSFDAVFMIEVLDYIPEVAEAFGECRRVLKSKSSLVLSFGNRSSLKSILREFHGKSYLHSYKKVMSYLLQEEFTVTKKIGYNWLPFGRMSNSRWVLFTSFMEWLLRLRKIPSLSPWVMICAEKSN